MRTDPSTAERRILITLGLLAVAEVAASVIAIGLLLEGLRPLHALAHMALLGVVFWTLAGAQLNIRSIGGRSLLTLLAVGRTYGTVAFLAFAIFWYFFRLRRVGQAE